MNLPEATDIAHACARREPPAHTCAACAAPCHHVDADGLCASCQPATCTHCGRVFASEELSADRGECKGCRRERYDDEVYEMEDCDDEE